MSAPISNGVYRLSAVTGALGAVAAGSDVFAWRYAPATPGAATYAVLEYLAVSAIVSATITASVLFDLAAYAARL